MRTLLVAALLLAASTTRASTPDPDPWLGRDKALHFAATFGLAVAGYSACAAVSQKRWVPLVCGGGLAMGAGLAKEGLDLAGYGDPSWRDLAWDAIGTATGLLVAYAADRLVFRPEPGAAVARQTGWAPAAPDPLAAARVRELLQLRQRLAKSSAPL